MYFLTKFLAKLKIDMNEILENIIDNDDHEPVPEYDTAKEHEESNKEGEVIEDELRARRYLDLKKQIKLTDHLKKMSNLRKDVSDLTTGSSDGFKIGLKKKFLQ